MILDDKMTKLIFSIIKYKVKNGEEVFIRGFGKFYLKDGEIAFQCSFALKEAINPEKETWEEFMKRMKEEYRA